MFTEEKRTQKMPNGVYANPDAEDMFVFVQWVINQEKERNLPAGSLVGTCLGHPTFISWEIKTEVLDYWKGLETSQANPSSSTQEILKFLDTISPDGLDASHVSFPPEQMQLLLQEPEAKTNAPKPRTLMARQFNRFYGIRPSHDTFTITKKNVIPSNGGAGALHDIFQALADIMPNQYYATPFPRYILYSGSHNQNKLHPIMVEPGQRFTASLLNDSFMKAKALGHKIGAILLCNPSNPMGTVINDEEWNHFIDILNAKEYQKCYFIIDEAYIEMVFNPKHRSFLTYIAELYNQSTTSAEERKKLENIRERVIIIRSGTKGLSYAGERLSAVLAFSPIILEQLTKVISYSGTPPYSSQVAYANALTSNHAPRDGLAKFSSLQDYYQRQVAYLANSLEKFGLNLTGDYKVEGTFYILANFSRLKNLDIGAIHPDPKKHLKDKTVLAFLNEEVGLNLKEGKLSTDIEIAYYLLFAHDIAITPLSFFKGDANKAYFRITCSVGKLMLDAFEQKLGMLLQKINGVTHLGAAPASASLLAPLQASDPSISVTQIGESAASSSVIPAHGNSTSSVSASLIKRSGPLMSQHQTLASAITVSPSTPTKSTPGIFARRASSAFTPLLSISSALAPSASASSVPKPAFSKAINTLPLINSAVPQFLDPSLVLNGVFYAAAGQYWKALVTRRKEFLEQKNVSDTKYRKEKEEISELFKHVVNQLLEKSKTLSESEGTHIPPKESVRKSLKSLETRTQITSKNVYEDLVLITRKWIKFLKNQEGIIHPNIYSLISDTNLSKSLHDSISEDDALAFTKVFKGYKEGKGIFSKESKCPFPLTLTNSRKLISDLVERWIRYTVEKDQKTPCSSLVYSIIMQHNWDLIETVRNSGAAVPYGDVEGDFENRNIMAETLNTDYELENSNNAIAPGNIMFFGTTIHALIHNTFNYNVILFNPTAKNIGKKPDAIIFQSFSCKFNLQLSEEEFNNIIETFNQNPEACIIIDESFIELEKLAQPRKSLFKHLLEDPKLKNRLILIRSATGVFSTDNERISILITYNNVLREKFLEENFKMQLHPPRSLQNAYRVALENFIKLSPSERIALKPRAIQLRKLCYIKYLTAKDNVSRSFSDSNPFLEESDDMDAEHLHLPAPSPLATSAGIMEQGWPLMNNSPNLLSSVNSKGAPPPYLLTEGTKESEITSSKPTLFSTPTSPRLSSTDPNAEQMPASSSNHSNAAHS